MKTPIIRDWYIGYPPLAMNYKLPISLMNSCLRGLMFDNEKDTKGRVAIIPDIKLLDTNSRLIKTGNKIYCLGDPEKKWKEWLDKTGIKLSEFDFNCF